MKTSNIFCKSIRNEFMKIYLDMNIYNRQFDDQSQIKIKLETLAIELIFSLIEMNKIKVVWSSILSYENSLNPYEIKKE